MLPLRVGSGYRTACGSLNLKPYSTSFCNMTVTHNESAVGLVKTDNTNWRAVGPGRLESGRAGLTVALT